MRNVTLISWNVNGIRSQLKKDFLSWVGKISPDILCLQETKAREDQLPPELLSPKGYETFWSAAEKPGYSGVSIWSKMKPISCRKGFGVSKFDLEGRIIQADFDDFTLLNIYFPNGGSGEERLCYKLEFYAAAVDYFKKLQNEKKRLIVCGDYNIAHHPIDLAEPEKHEDVSGFMPVERQWLDQLVRAGLVDTFRAVHPDQRDKYTWWDQRIYARRRNSGWRIDYFFISDALRPCLREAFIWDDVQGSDHCPVGITLQF